MNKLAQVNIGNSFNSPFNPQAGGQGVGDLVGLVVQSSIVIAGVVVLFLFLFAGFKIIQGAGSDDPQETAQGRQALTWAIIGFVLIFTSYWIIRIIEVITGFTFVTSPGI